MATYFLKRLEQVLTCYGARCYPGCNMAKVSTHKPANSVFKDIVRTVVREELIPVDRRLDRVEERLNRLETGQNKLEDRIIAFEERMEAAFQKFRSDIFDHIDPLVGEIRTYREEQAVNAGQHQRFDERLEKLEEVHPQGQHTQA